MRKSSNIREYSLVFLVESYAHLVRYCDQFFGGITILTLLLAIQGWRTGLVPISGLASLTTFMVANILISQIVVRFRGLFRVRVELARIFILNGVLCPITLINLGNRMLVWWPGYLIVTLGTAIVMGSVFPRFSWKSVLGVFFWPVNFWVVGWYGFTHPDRWDLILQAVTILMTGLIFLRFAEAFIEKALAEHRLFEDASDHLEEAQAKLIEAGKLAALGQMAAGIAHEINSPLAVLKLYLMQLQRSAKTGQLNADLLMEKTALTCAVVDRISGIISGLRAYSREGEQDPMQQQAVGKIIHDTLVFSEERFRTGNVSLEICPAGMKLICQCRPVQISQVLLNLLNNAYEAVCTSEKRWVRIAAREAGPLIEISVQDSGPGIPPELRAKIFEPFFSTKSNQEGIGMGLSISKRIVESHGGTLSLETDASYTKFLIGLPLG